MRGEPDGEIHGHPFAATGLPTFVTSPSRIGQAVLREKKLKKFNFYQGTSMRTRNLILTGFILAMVTAISGCGGGSSSGTVTPPSSAVKVTVQPSSATVSDFTTKQFGATVTGSTNSAVTWKVNGIIGGTRKSGFISSSGLYVAPSGVPTKADGSGGSVTTTITVSAASQADATASGSSTVTVLPQNANAQTGVVELGTTGGNAHDSITGSKNITCCGGTLGSLVTRGGVQYVLSNNHILARTDAAIIGDDIVQPGLIDTATCTTAETTTVANLSEFFNLQKGPLPNIDAALAKVIPGKIDPADKIVYLGASVDGSGVPVADAPQGGSGLPTASIAVNRAVAKSGRSTGLTCSTVAATNFATSVDYAPNCDGTGTKFTVNYNNQIDILGGDFSAEGDSGALIVTQDSATPVALLYAGSDTDSVGNPIADVLNYFATSGNPVTIVGGGTHPVVGCSLPNAPQSAKKVVATSVSAEVLHQAAVTRDLHGPELMAHPEVQAVGVGASYDNPQESAIVFFVTKGQARSNLPAAVDGVRTRIVEAALFDRRGTVSAEESEALEKTAAAPQMVYAVSNAEIARAKLVHAAHVATLMKQAGVQGVGIGSSVDSPGEAALVVAVIRGVAHEPIPAMIDGLRTRVRESSRFRAGGTDSAVPRTCKLPDGTKRNSKVVEVKH